jgi:hypothetical protein
LALLAVAYTGLFWLYPSALTSAEATLVMGVWIVASVALVVLSLVRAPRARFGAVALFLLAAPGPFYNSAEDYIDLHSTSHRAMEWDLYHASIELQQIVGAHVKPELNRTRFWYNSELPGHSALSSLQSTYLWGFTRIPDMPAIGDTFTRNIQGARHLVLLGADHRETAAGLAALSNAGIPFSIVHEQQVGGAVWSCVVLIVRLPRGDAESPR